MRHAHLDTTGHYLTARIEDMHDKVQDTTPSRRRRGPVRPAKTPLTSRRCSVVEPGTTQVRNDSSVPPARFAGLRGGPAKPVASTMPRGDLTAAGIGEIQQVVRAVWPGGHDAVRRRARGARSLLEHLAGIPGPAWQQRWEASGLNERGCPVTAVRGKQAGRDEICVGTPACSASG
jgi:hypothetical protein